MRHKHTSCLHKKNKRVYFIKKPDIDIDTILSATWRVIDKSSEEHEKAVVFMNMEHRHYYLHCGSTGKCRVRRCLFDDPCAYPGITWIIEDENAQECNIQSIRARSESRRFLAMSLTRLNYRWAITANRQSRTESDNFVTKLCIRPISVTEEFEVIATLDNTEGMSEESLEYNERIGISNTSGTRLSAKVCAKIGTAVQSHLEVTSSFKDIWEKYRTTIWTAETTEKKQITIKPGTSTTLYQLVAQYGLGYKIHTKVFKIICDPPLHPENISSLALSIKDRYVEIAVGDNSAGISEQIVTYTKTVGISSTDNTNLTLERCESIGSTVQTHLQATSTFKDLWRRFSITGTTWKHETTEQAEFSVKPGEKASLHQLVANYGSLYVVKTCSFKIVPIQ